MNLQLIGLSNTPHNFEEVLDLQKKLQTAGFNVMIDSTLAYPCSPELRAEAFNEGCRSNMYDWIVDISGGDLANEVLPYLDYEAYADSRSFFCGFSDLSVVLNALYAETGKQTLLFPVAYQTDFDKVFRILNSEVPSELDVQSYFDVLDGDWFIGGNLRCFLKLAGTPYFPVCEGAILVAEGMRTSKEALYSMMAQLGQIGVFTQIKSILFGRFNALENSYGPEGMMDLFEDLMDRLGLEDLPWGYAPNMGHIKDCTFVMLGEEDISQDEPDSSGISTI